MVCGVIFICAAALQELRAQAPAVDPCEASKPAVAAAPPKGSDEKPPDNIADKAKAALADEWDTPDGVEHVLKALKLLTSSSKDPAITKEVLNELTRGDSKSADLYSAAMGDPDTYGQPTVQGLPNFLDTLAKANKLKKEPERESDLFVCTKSLITEIFEAPSSPVLPPQKHKKNQQKPEELSGPIAIARINSYFSGKEIYVALYQLLEAYPKSEADKQKYADHLEKLRAAFETDSDKLAKQVAAKVTASKE